MPTSAVLRWAPNLLGTKTRWGRGVDQKCRSGQPAGEGYDGVFVAEDVSPGIRAALISGSQIGPRRALRHPVSADHGHPRVQRWVVLTGRSARLDLGL
jgi:hypothetical protein